MAPSSAPIACFIRPFSPVTLKRPRSSTTRFRHDIRLSSNTPPTCCHNPFHTSRERASRIVLTVLASTAAALTILLHPSAPVDAKNLLTDNTIFRRYLVVDPGAILRYSLPLPSERTGDPEPPVIRLVQSNLEKLGVHLRSRGIAGLITGRRDLAELKNLLSQRQLDVLLDVPAKSRVAAADALTRLENCVNQMAAELGADATPAGPSFLPPNILQLRQNVRDALTPRNSVKNAANFDAAYIESLRTEALDQVSEIELIAVQGADLPFRIPRRYNSLPRLLGRAQVALRLQKASGNFTGLNGEDLGREATVKATLDGFSAPITAGNFVDLVRRGYYNGTPVLSTERQFFALMGERMDDDVTGFVDNSGTARHIPLEILVEGERVPIYGSSLDDAGIGDLQPVLPVTAYGALAMVHSIEDANDASSQFYVFMLDPTSYQARAVGGTALSGSLSTFGYVVDGVHFLPQLKEGDLIASTRVVSGEENFRSSGES